MSISTWIKPPAVPKARIVALMVVALTGLQLLARPAPHAAAATVGPTYTVQDLGVFADGGNATYATGINAEGDVSGYGNHGAPGFTAFRWSSSTATLSDLGSFGCGSQANAINGSGTVVGFSNVTCAESDKAGFEESGSGLQDVGTIFAHPTVAYAINGSGQIVGSSVTANGTGRAFITGAGGLGSEQVDNLVTSEPPGAQTLEAHGVNSAGDIVGIAAFFDQTCGGYDAPFIVSGGTLQNLEGLGGCSGQANAINDSGQVVGFEGVAGSFSHAFSWDGTVHDLGVPTGMAISDALAVNSGGTVVGYSLASQLSPPEAWVDGPTGGMQLLNDLIDPALGWDLQSAAAINDSGQIAGYGTFNGATHAFRLTPVAAKTLTAITVTPTNPNVAHGSTQQLAATGTFSDGSSADVTSTAMWSSSDPSVATVDASGLVTAVGPGQATETATVGYVSGSTTVTVPTPVTLTTITVSPANPTIPKGAAQQFTATGTYSDGSTADLTASVTWSSSKPKVASINSSGLLTTATRGTLTVTATDGLVSGSTGVTVGPKTLVSLSISPRNTRTPIGTTVQFTGAGIFTDGSTIDLTTKGAWRTSTTNFATIGLHTGLATAKKNGTTTIKFLYGKFTPATTTLTVGPMVTE